MGASWCHGSLAWRRAGEWAAGLVPADPRAWEITGRIVLTCGSEIQYPRGALIDYLSSRPAPSCPD